MDTLLLVVLLLLGYVAAYHTYGKYVARRIFRLDPAAPVPSHAQRDDVDYVPTNRFVLFGHHFTTIAGTGPIVGPAIAIIWGWVPAVLWVFFGSIFMGAIHDFGALVVSLRHKGRSIGDIAGDLVGPRVRLLFLLIIFFVLVIVIAIFALVIAGLFRAFPVTVIPVWSQLPLAVILGYLVYRRNLDHRLLGLIATALLYAIIVAGAQIPAAWIAALKDIPLVVWMLILFLYVYLASTLPVQTLLQPRDYINAYQLFLAMGLLFLGLLVARPELVAPAVHWTPEAAPPLWPFLFVTIACGAISGFHSLASSGTTSKQCANESESLLIGYGGMLTEGALAVLVIAAVAGGLGLGLPVQTEGGSPQLLTGAAAFRHHYASWNAAEGLPAMLGAFITGGVNMIASLGIDAGIIRTLLGVFIVSFAATTLDSATRIQRYVIAELADSFRVPVFGRRHPATFLAVLTAFGLAFHRGFDPAKVQQATLVLWPLFGTANQLLGGLALLVLTVYLARRRADWLVTAVPMALMIVMTGWALVLKLGDFRHQENWFLLAVGAVILLLEFWMIVECGLALRPRRLVTGDQ